MESSELLEKLETLETRMAYQERTIEELNEVIAGHWREIDRLKRQIAAIDDQIAAVEHFARAGGREPPPPHY